MIAGGHGRVHLPLTLLADALGVAPISPFANGHPTESPPYEGAHSKVSPYEGGDLEGVKLPLTFATSAIPPATSSSRSNTSRLVKRKTRIPSDSI